MKACEIFHITHKKSFRWKWRHTNGDGPRRRIQGKLRALYFECVTAAARRRI